MEYMTADSLTHTQHTILCCECGSPTIPNASNMCVGCIRSKVDITEGIQKQAVLQFCKGCERYLQPPGSWVACTLESRELMSLCLKRLKGLAKVKLIDASFIWTEPHSKRVKLKLTIQKEVLGSTILQQIFVVEFVVQGHMCDMCHRREAKDSWKAVVQVRQKVCHHVKNVYLDGLDFFYGKREEARKLVDFLMTVVPCRHKTSEQLISHDIHNNTYNYKYTFSVELVPICKDDIVCIPLKLSRSLGNIGQILICYKVTSSLHFINPSTLQVAELQANAYWRTPFNSICSNKQLIEYTILEADNETSRSMNRSKYQGADVYVMRSEDMGATDDQIHCRTHLGHILTTGDTVLGFHLMSSNLNDENFEKMKEDQIPSVVLVKKSYGDKRKRRKYRNWKLKGLAKDTTGIDPDGLMKDYDDFLDDLEEDRDYRHNINIYKGPFLVSFYIPLHERSQSVGNSSDADGAPRIGLEEMLNDLNLEDQEMASASDSD
eukprot:gene17668-19430_t